MKTNSLLILCARSLTGLVANAGPDTRGHDKGGVAPPADQNSTRALDHQLSWQAGGMDVNGKMMYGTELLCLMPFKGQVQASTALWTENDPAWIYRGQLTSH